MISWKRRRRIIFRLKPGGEVRLKYAFIIKCDEVVKDAAGNVIELRCTADFDSRTGGPNAGRKVKGTIHWVSAAHAIDAEVRLYDRLFTVPNPTPAGDFKQLSTRIRWKSSPPNASQSLKDAAARSSATNSSAWPISPWTRTAPPASSSSTAPSPSKTPGRRKRASHDPGWSH